VRLAVLSLAFLLAACGPPPRVVKRADATQTVTAADAALRRAFQARDGEAAAAFFADKSDASPDGQMARFGGDVRMSLDTLKADPHGKVQFHPAGQSVASQAGDIAYTMGVLDWTASSTPEHDYPVTRSATYLYIWRIQTDGSWRVVQAISREIQYESPYKRFENNAAPRAPPLP